MNDLISRQAAIAYAISGLTREIDGEKWIRVSEVRESIKALSSPQSEIIRCKDCKHCIEDKGDLVSVNVCELNHNKVQPDDWFCADGERKEE